MSRNIVRQINRAMLPQQVEELTNLVTTLRSALDDVMLALINAGVLEIEAPPGGRVRLVPVKKRAKRSLWVRLTDMLGYGAD